MNETHPSWKALSPYICYQLFLTANSAVSEDNPYYLKIKAHETIKLSKLKLSITAFSSKGGDKYQEVVELVHVDLCPFVVKLFFPTNERDFSTPHTLIIQIHEIYNAAEPNINLITSEVKEEAICFYGDIP